MSFCMECGARLADNGACPNCHAAERSHVGTVYQGQPGGYGGYRPNGTDYEMMCPRCGNRNLQMINQSSVSTSGKDYSAGKGCLGWLLLGPLGLLCGLCGKGQQVNSTNTLLWICPRCGTTVDSRSTTTSSGKKGSGVGIVLAIIFLIIAILIIMMMAFFTTSMSSSL